jgi:hypothetical protein
VLGAGQLKIICSNSEQEEAEEELEVDYRGDALDIGFNITYLLDVLQNQPMERVQLAFGDANSSALITIPDRDDYKYVVMPRRIGRAAARSRRPQRPRPPAGTRTGARRRDTTEGCNDPC